MKTNLFNLLWAFVLLFAASLLPVAAQKSAPESLWQFVADQTLISQSSLKNKPTKFLIYKLNQAKLKTVLSAALPETAMKMRAATLELPTPDGKLTRFKIEESSVLAPEIAAQFPDFKTYQGYGVDEPAATVRIDVTINGFHAQVLSPAGTYLIDPLNLTEKENHLVYYKRDLPDENREFHCQLDKLLSGDGEAASANLTDAPAFSSGTNIRTYRLAMAATGEYTAFFRQTGDTDATAQTRAFGQIVTTTNRVSGVYRRDLGVSFTLVSGTNIVYPNAATDPYANTSNDLTANQANIDAVIGTANYDVGHLVGTGGGGVAYLGVICRTGNKAQGLTGSPAPVNDAFDIDYVAHEIGHQIGGNHTFNSSNGSCGSSNRNASTAYEPGSGVTVMAYAGICGASDLQKHSIDNFNIISQTEALTYITTGLGSSCGTLSTGPTNSIPVIAALTNYTIPFNTPFTLTANATDADNDALTYSWEEYDLGAASSYPTTPDADDTTLAVRPLFRSYSPVTSNSRIYPSLPYILNSANKPPLNFTGTAPSGAICSSGTCVTGEDLPSIARAMNFRVAVRDNKGGNADAGMVVTVINTTTPFRVTVQNSSPTIWGGGSSQTVTWDVSGTNAGSINAANVKISLSTDGGLTFPTVLANSVPNNGTAIVTVPNVSTTTARLKVEAVGNIFFDINDTNFTIQTTTAAAVNIGGRLTTNQSAPLRGVLITLTNTNTNAVRSTRTNARGVYRFYGVAAGQSYTISVTRPAFNFSPSQNILASLSGENLNVNFVATPAN